VYALRLFIRAMHNRVGGAVDSHEIGLLDGAVLAPIVAVIALLALYPQLALHRSEGSVKAAVAGAQAARTPGLSTASLGGCPPAAVPHTEGRACLSFPGRREQ